MSLAFNSLEWGFENFVIWLPLFFCLISVVYYCLAIYSAIDFLSQKIPAAPNFYPPISLLKPLCGLDPNTYGNLASFCYQDYPNYQIVFGVQDPTDPAIAVVRQLIHDFPTLDIQLVVSDRAIGTNLKISNLANALTAAKHELLLISDSDIYVGTDYLKTVVQPLQDPTVGVVTCTYRSKAEGWIATLEALGISTELVPTVLVSRKLEGMTFGIGATVVLRRSVLESFGGFAAIANYLHDDFHLGRLPASAGYRVVLSNYMVTHVLGRESFSTFFQHQTRWNRGIRLSQPAGYAGQIFTFGTVASLLFLLTSHGSSLSWSILGITWLFRFAMAWTVGVKTLNDPIVKKWLWLVPLSDLIRFAMWCAGFVGNTIEWRGRQFKLTSQGELIEIEAIRLEARI
ncbi:MAG: glycosyl transferase [Leptolyngbya sp.]|nr:MAG: glycosyl transferase [Leptolyngbya sp.]